MSLLNSISAALGHAEYRAHAEYLERARSLYTDDLDTQPQGGGRIPTHRLLRPSHFDLQGYREAYAAADNKPTRRAVIYPTMVCNERCKFCYYLDMIENPRRAPDEEIPLGGARHRDLERSKLELEVYRRYYDLTHVDITGGEPTIYPGIVELVKYAAELGIAPTVISNAQRPKAWEELIDSGLEDALLSIHGFREEQDAITQKKGSWERLMGTIEEFHRLDFAFRTNCVVGIWNYKYLPDLARTLADEVGPRIHNFIVFNPHEGNQWGRDYDGSHRDFEQQAGYSAIAPYLKEAIDVLLAKGIWPNVRYMPLCTMTGYEQYICNFYQWQYDPHEWFYHQYSHRQYSRFAKKARKQGFHGEGLDAGLNYLSKKAETPSNVYADSCKDCDLLGICDGIYPQYGDAFGLEEFKPVSLPGGAITDPMHFRKHYVGYRLPRAAWKGPGPDVVRELAPHGNLWSAGSDAE